MKKFIFILFVAIMTICQVALSAQDSNIVWMKYTANISRLQFSKDDSKILTVGEGGIIIFDTQTGNRIKQFPGNGSYSEDGTIIYSSHLNDIDHYIEIYDASTYESIRKIQLPDIKGSYGVTLSPDGKTFIAGGWDDLFFIDFTSGTIKKHLTQFGNETRPIRVGAYPFSKDGKYVIVGLADPNKGSYGELMFINSTTYQMDYVYNKGWKGGFALSDDGTMIAFVSNIPNKAIEIMNLQSQEIIGNIPGDNSMICGLTFSPDGKYIAVSGPNSLYTDIYKTINFSKYQTIKYAQCFAGLAFAKNNQYFVGGGGQRIVLFNLLTTDVSDYDTSNEIIYPNPTNGMINMQINITQSSILTATLTDISGRNFGEVYNKFTEQGNTNILLNLIPYPTGNYFISLTGLNYSKKFKIILNK